MEKPETTDDPHIYLAPLRGITDLVFRNVFARHFKGVDSCIAPFINPQKNPSNKVKLLADVFPENNRLMPVIPQLLNNHAEQFLDLATRLEDLGYTHLNWNLGCPAPMVANKGRGSGLLPYPEQIIELLDTVLPQLKSTISIKMRLGFKEKTESLYLLPLLDNYPLEEIIIHPRLGKQMYKGRTDPEGFALCREKTRHRLVYNGDITSTAVYREHRARFPEITRWMLGRGLLSNPFLAEELKGLPSGDRKERKQRLYDFHQELQESYRSTLSGPGHLLGKMKQLWLYLHHSFPEKPKLIKKIKKAKTESQFTDGVEQMFS